MKKFGALLAAGILFLVPAFAQNPVTQGSTNIKGNFTVLPVHINQLPLPASATNAIRTVDNAVDAGDCTIGGGSTKHLCFSNGSVWTPVGGNGSGGPDPNAVHYPVAGSQYYFFGSSHTNSSDGPTYTASAISCDGTNCTVTTNHAHAAGDVVRMGVEGGTSMSPSCLADATTRILSSGLDATHFQIPETNADMKGTGAGCSGVLSGTGGGYSDGNGYLGALVQKEPFFKNHGTVHFNGGTYNGSIIAGSGGLPDTYTSFIHPLTPAVTSINPTYFFLLLGLNDAIGCSSVPSMETGAQTLWSNIHTDGGIVVVVLEPAYQKQVIVGCSTTPLILGDYTKWLRAQGPGQHTDGKNWDYIVDSEQLLGSQNGLLWNSARNQNTSVAGNQVWADLINAAMANEGSAPQSNGAGGGFALIDGQYYFQSTSGGLNNNTCPINYFNPSAGYNLTFQSCSFGNVELEGVASANNGMNTFFLSASAHDSARGTETKTFAGNAVLGFCSASGSGLSGTGCRFGGDVGFSRDSAGWADLGNGFKQDVTGGLKLTNLIITPQASDPVTPTNGQMWYNTSTNQLKAFINGAVQLLGSAGSLSNPMTTAGDLIIGTTGGVPARLAAGTNGKVLQVTGGVPTWQTFSGTSVPNIQIASPTTAISAGPGTCTAFTATAMPGVIAGVPGTSAGSTFTFTPAVTTTGVAGWDDGSLYIRSYPTADTVNWKVCNGSTSAVTPGALYINVGAK